MINKLEIVYRIKKAYDILKVFKHLEQECWEVSTHIENSKNITNIYRSNNLLEVCWEERKDDSEYKQYIYYIGY